MLLNLKHASIAFGTEETCFLHFQKIWSKCFRISRNYWRNLYYSSCIKTRTNDSINVVITIDRKQGGCISPSETGYCCDSVHTGNLLIIVNAILKCFYTRILDFFNRIPPVPRTSTYSLQLSVEMNTSSVFFQILKWILKKCFLVIRSLTVDRFILWSHNIMLHVEKVLNLYFVIFSTFQTWLPKVLWEIQKRLETHVCSDEPEANCSDNSKT